VKNIIKKTAITTFILLLGGIFLFNNGLSNYYLPIFPWMLGGFLFLTYGVHFFLIKSSKDQDPKKFNNIYMMTFTIKMVCYLVFIFIYLLNHKENRITFIIAFAILYFIFTSLEISSILSHIKKQKTGN